MNNKQNNQIHPKDIEHELNFFVGCEIEDMVKYGVSILTTGAQYVAKECCAYWLLDIINSVQLIKKVKAEYFQVYDLEVKDNTAKVIVTDGNNNVLYKQNIPYTDFPLDKVTLWRVNGTIMLPGEY